MKGLLEKRRVRKEEEEKKRRDQLIKQVKADTAMNLEILRSIKSRPPEGCRTHHGHHFRWNATIYEVQIESLRRKLREVEATLEDIGTSEEELGEIYRAAVRADIIVDAKEFGLTVVEDSKVLSG